MKNKHIYIVVTLLAVVLSGCVEQTDQFIKHPYIPGVSTGDKPVTDNEKIIGIWEFSNQNGYIRYSFDKDTGIEESSVYGKIFFNYELFQNKIIRTNVRPCIVSCDGEIRYEFADNGNALILNNQITLERK